jgi:hypothetical protein
LLSGRKRDRRLARCCADGGGGGGRRHVECRRRNARVALERAGRERRRWRRRRRVLRQLVARRRDERRRLVVGRQRLRVDVAHRVARRARRAAGRRRRCRCRQHRRRNHRHRRSVLVILLRIGAARCRRRRRRRRRRRHCEAVGGWHHQRMQTTRAEVDDAGAVGSGRCAVGGADLLRNAMQQAVADVAAETAVATPFVVRRHVDESHVVALRAVHVQSNRSSHVRFDICKEVLSCAHTTGNKNNKKVSVVSIVLSFSRMLRTISKLLVRRADNIVAVRNKAGIDGRRLWIDLLHIANDFFSLLRKMHVVCLFNRTRTKTCHTSSLTALKLQNRMLIPAHNKR